MAAKKDYIQSPFFVHKEHYDTWLKVHDLILKFKRDEKSVPFVLVDIYFTLLISEKDVLFRTILQKVSVAQNKFNTSIEGRKEAFFIGSEKINGWIAFCELDVFGLCFIQYYLESEKDASFNNRLAAFKFFYDSLYKFNSFLFKTTHNKFSEYTIVVLASRLTEGVGFKFTTKAKPTNKELFDSAKYSLSKINSKTKKLGGVKK